MQTFLYKAQGDGYEISGSVDAPTREAALVLAGERHPMRLTALYEAPKPNKVMPAVEKMARGVLRVTGPTVSDEEIEEWQADNQALAGHATAQTCRPALHRNLRIGVFAPSSPSKTEA